MIDRVTYDRYVRAVASSQHEGRDLGEELDRGGVLLTEERRALVVRSALRDAQVEIDRLGAAEIMRARFGRPQGTPAEMHEAIVGWLDVWIKGRG